MDIAKRLYQELSPTQRASAVYAAINRADNTEADRLVGQAPRRGGHNKAIFGTGQALDAYNRLTAQFTREILLQVNKASSALSYCEGWLDAGGAPDDAEYSKRYLEAEVLLEISAVMRGMLEAVKQAAREWCKKNGVSTEVFSGPMAFLSLVKKNASELDDNSPVDDTTLEQMRSLFDEITLSW